MIIILLGAAIITIYAVIRITMMDYNGPTPISTNPSREPFASRVTYDDSEGMTCSFSYKGGHGSTPVVSRSGNGHQ